MENKDWIKELMTYLYEEMTIEEKQNFEKILESDPELKQELESLKRVRKDLASVKDKEIVEPMTITDDPRTISWRTHPGTRNIISLRSVFAIAASIILILTIGYLTQFHIQYQNGNLLVGFNQQPVSIENASLTKDQIAKLVKHEIEKNYGHIENRLAYSDSSVNAKLASIESGAGNQGSSAITKMDLENYIRLTQNNQTQMLKDYLQNTGVQQQKYFETVLTQFSDVIQEQRESDMYMIKRNLVNMKENQDQQTQETNQVLARLLTTNYTQNE